MYDDENGTYDESWDEGPDVDGWEDPGEGVRHESDAATGGWTGAEQREMEAWIQEPPDPDWSDDEPVWDEQAYKDALVDAGYAHLLKERWEEVAFAVEDWEEERREGLEMQVDATAATASGPGNELLDGWSHIDECAERGIEVLPLENRENWVPCTDENQDTEGMKQARKHREPWW